MKNLGREREREKTPVILEMERPRAMVEYTNDMTAATMDNHHS